MNLESATGHLYQKLEETMQGTDDRVFMLNEEAGFFVYLDSDANFADGDTVLWSVEVRPLTVVEE